MDPVVCKYLEVHADPRIRPYTCLPFGVFDTAVVIPAFNEAEFLPKTLESLEKAAEASRTRALVFVVINHKISTLDEDKVLNRRLLEELKSFETTHTQIVPLDFVSAGREFDVKEGVGDARKIGSDLALWLFQEKKIKSSFFHHTDGDAIVPLDYFLIEWKKDLSAQVADYEHVASGDKLLDEAHVLYEDSLRHYERGLKEAGSPYAFPTIGSLLTISFRHYAMVRGFPRRLAAEDFYILNKLAKVGRVEKRSVKVLLRARPSDRVPFGTGNGVSKILSEGLEKFKMYDKAVFQALKEVLGELERFPEHRSIEKTKARLNAPYFSGLETLGFWSMLESANRSRPSNEDCRRHLRDSFDAFKTLKFVHFLRDHHFSSRPYSTF